MRITLLVVFLVTISFTLSAQENITGLWKVNSVKSLQRNDAATKTRYDSLPAEVKQRVKNSFDGREFNFKSDGTATIGWKVNNVANEVSGKWNYDGANKQLFITLADGKKKDYKVVEATATYLVLKLSDTGGLFQELYLVKQ